MEVQVIKRESQNKKRLKVAAYCRVSTDSDEQEGSIERQKEYYRDLITKNPEYEFVDVYYDFGISGFKERRPGFQKMMKDARAGKIELIITKSITRFARNTDIVLKSTRELKAMGIGVFFELQNMNTLTQAGELLLTVYAAFAQGESDTYRELAHIRYKQRVADANPEMQLQKTLGYELSDTGELVINEREAEQVRQLFRWTKEGYTPQRILEMCAEQGITRRDGRPLIYSRYYNMIRNVSYRGDYIMGQHYVDETRKNRVNYGELPMYLIEDNHPAIVSKRLWQQANDVIDARAAKRLERRELLPMTTENYPYKDKLFCACCGYRLRHVKNNVTSTQWAFKCSGRDRMGAEFCQGISIQQKEIETWPEITDNIYISFDASKPVGKQYSWVKESTWKKDHKKKPGLQPMEPYDEENYHYCKRIFCDKCGFPLVRSRRQDGTIYFTCAGKAWYKKEFCSGVIILKSDLDRLPKQEGYFRIREEIIDGKKNYSYTCDKEEPQRKQHS